MARGLQRGTTLGGRYRLEELVGTGGMGSVYAAQDLERGHRVAVKVLRRRHAQRTEFRERFVAESRAAASIPHPHILTVHDHGEDDGWHYIVMALAPTDLATMLEGVGTGGLSVVRTLNIAEQVAWALDVAHAQGMVHRDVKPENVLVAPRGDATEPDHAYLADFGIAKLENAEAGLTRTGVFVGTVSYASPEQIAGRPLDGRSDQYALACVLFEALTGVPPFTGDDAEAVLRAHADAPRPDASARVPGLPPALDAVLRRGLAVDREERFGTCGELVQAARRAVRDATTASSADAPTATPGGDDATPDAGEEPGAARTRPGAPPTAATGPGPPPTAATGPGPPPTAATRPGPPPTAATRPGPHPPVATEPRPQGSALAGPVASRSTAPDPPTAPRPTDTGPPIAPRSGPPEPSRTQDGPLGGGRPRRGGRGLVGAGVGVLLVAVVAAVVLIGGSDDDGEPTGPGRSGPSESDVAAAERAVRQTVRAFGAARGARATCATLSAADQSGCENRYETAQPATLSVRDVRVGGDVATAEAAHDPDGDRLSFELAREDGVWLLTDVPTFDWKDADEAAVAETVIRFAARDREACSLLAEPIAPQCSSLLPPQPVSYDITSLTAGSTASVTGQLVSGDTDRYELVDAGDDWRISAIE